MVKQVVISNLLISYSEAQGGGNQALLFLHGWRSDKQVWQGAIEGLKDLKIERFGVYALDLPGFGLSQNPHPSPLPSAFAKATADRGEEGGWGVADYADIVAEFIRKLELKNVIIVGHSFGGRVGIKLASIHPELISKLVLVDSAGFPMPAGKKSLMKAVAKIAKPFFKPNFMQGLRKKIYRQIGAEDYLATPELQQTFVNITSEDLSEDMKKVQAPTLIVNGENDKITPVEFGELMKFLIPNSKFLILKGAGHFSFLDKPQEFAEALKFFTQS